ncbi:MAG: DUF2207 domain-containing protein [Dehalococcoidia bacterium]|nr:DUF2207 domain-containing protein [Dehalococcoidia bacterium]
MRKVVSEPGIRPLLLIALFLAVALALPARVARAEEAMRSFDALYEIQEDGSILVTEQIVWDFEDLPDRHGIFRSLIVKQDCSDETVEELEPEFTPDYPCRPGFEREYPVQVISVQDAAGNPVKYEVSTDGGVKHIKIGDAKRTVSGEQTYVIRYRLERALDSYPNHDELYWNATGHQWQVAIESARVEVRVPGGSDLQLTCWEGSVGSERECATSAEGDGVATFATTRPLFWRQGITILVGFPKGTVDVPPPLLHDKPSIDDYFELDALEIGGAVIMAILSLGAVVALWWRHGRDRSYRSLYYLTNDPTEHTRPLFAKQDVVVEFLPPDGLKPAQMGVILDERADSLDVTATIVDLAVRGHLHITEIPKKSRRGKQDWRLEKRQNEDDPLLPYEQVLWDALFPRRESVLLSKLKDKFAENLKKVKSELYADAMERHWFSSKPESAQQLWFIIGLGAVALGAGLAVLAGLTLGRALLGLPVALGGVALLLLAPSMKRRTATGSEALRRVLGFRHYIVTAETRMQEFNEQRNIFARYLPYAIVFGAVDKWAKAFEQLDNEELDTSLGWYTGDRFSTALFVANMRTFSNSVTSTISSTPSSSGGSGFSGGSSGGGGGGGGGGSW